MHPKGTCSALLHCVGIAPYGRATRVRRVNVSPSAMAEGCDISLAEGGEGVPRLRARGTDSHASVSTGSE